MRGSKAAQAPKQRCAETAQGALCRASASVAATTRAASTIVRCGCAVALGAHQPPSPTEEERQFAPSLIAAYDASAIDADAAVGAPKRIPAARRLERLQEVSSPFGDDSLKKSYSLAFGTECALLAAVGHGGRAAIFAASGASIGTPLMSWKAHRGWVASCTLLGATAAAYCRQ